MSLTLRELVIKLGLDTNAQSFVKGQLAVEGIKLALKGLVSIAQGAIKATIGFAEETADMTEGLTRLSQQTGISVENLQAMQRAFEFTGAKGNTLQLGLKMLSRVMYQAKEGQKESAKAFSVLGLKATDASGKLKPLDEMMYEIGDAFAKMNDPVLRSAVAIKLFGRRGNEMIPTLIQGSAEMKRLATLVPALTDEQVKAGTAWARTNRIISALTLRLKQSLVGELFPALEELSKKYLKWKEANIVLIRQRLHEYVIVPLTKAIHFLSGALQVVIDHQRNFADVIKGSAAAVTILLIPSLIKLADALTKVTIKTITAMAPWLLIAAIVVAVGLAFDDLNTYLRGGESLIGHMRKELDDWLKVKEDDPWWLVIFKSFIDWVDKAEQKLAGFEEKLSASFLIKHFTPVGFVAGKVAEGVGGLWGEATSIGAGKGPGKRADVGPMSPGYSGTNYVPGAGLMSYQPIPRGQDVGPLPYSPGIAVPGQEAPTDYATKYLAAKAAGRGNFGANMAAMNAFEPGFTPSIPAPSSPISQVQQNSIVIHAAPGQSPEEIGKVVEEKVRSCGKELFQSCIQDEYEQTRPALASGGR